jgi:hypothetical protein
MRRVDLVVGTGVHFSHTATGDFGGSIMLVFAPPSDATLFIRLRVRSVTVVDSSFSFADDNSPAFT